MTLLAIIEHIYLPLLTQETAVMVSAFTYGIKQGATAPVLILTNTAAVLTDLLLFFVPAYFFADRLRTVLAPRYGNRYEQATNIVHRMGEFRMATAMAFVPPSVVAMVIVGLLRLSFWRTFGGLFLGSAAYVTVPLLLSLPLAATIPTFLLPVLPWIAPALAVILILVFGIRLWWSNRAATHKP